MDERTEPWRVHLSVGSTHGQIYEEIDGEKVIEEYIRQDIRLRDAFLLRETRDGAILNLSSEQVQKAKVTGDAQWSK